MGTRILVVDDEKDFSSTTSKLLRTKGFDSRVADSVDSARGAFADFAPKIVLLDVNLPDGSGLDLIPEFDAAGETRIVVMTGQPTIDVAIDSLRARVADFLVKPVEPKQLISTLERAERALKRATPIEPSADEGPTFEGFVGNSEAMLKIYRLIDRVAPSDASVLVQGQSGTGKELVAHAIHSRSERADKPFLSVNCGAVSKELITSQLFGHEKGSFTGSTGKHRGFFERANTGTLFLDEITEMPAELQVKFLRVLETGTLTRVGGEKEIAVDVRIVAATNRDPREAIEQGLLRQDLYYRLAVFPIVMPPLAQRGKDAGLIARHFLARINAETGVAKTLTDDAIDWINRQTWPGNVRELKNHVQRAHIVADGELDAALFDDLKEPAGEMPRADGLNVRPGMELADVEREMILSTLKENDGDKTRSAKTLGISLKTLYNKLKLYREQGHID